MIESTVVGVGIGGRLVVRLVLRELGGRRLGRELGQLMRYAWCAPLLSDGYAVV